MLRRISTFIFTGLLVAGLLPPTAAAAAARADTRAPKITKAEMLDRNGNGLADAVRLTYNEKVKHRLDTDGRYPFKVVGPTRATSYKIKKVNAAKRATRLLIILREKENGDATPDIKYVRTRSKPVRDLARNQARRQVFIRTLGLPIPSDTFMLTVTPPENGSIGSSPAGIDCGTDCSEAYPAGTEVTLTATPDEGGEFGGWNGACSGTAATCTVTMDADKTVAATFSAAGERVLTVEKTGAGAVTSTPSGIDCGETCTANFTDGEDVTLTATPDLNSSFLGWTGADGCADATTCTVTMDAAKTVQAEFTWVVTVFKTGPGSISSVPAGMNCASGVTTCAHGYAPGSSVVLSASPASGSKFVAWSGACTGTSALTGCTLTMDANKTVNAAFGYDLTVAKDNAGTGTGTVTSTSNPTQAQQISCGTTCTVTYPHGALVTLTAASEPGSVFEGWSGGVCSGTTLTCQVTVDAAKTVTAKFGLTTTTYTLTVSKTGGGLGSITGDGINCDGVLLTDCDETFTTGEVVQLTALAQPLSEFVSWGGDAASCGTNTICSITMTSVKNVTATFNLTTPVDGGGGGGGGSTFALSAVTSGANADTGELVCVPACSGNYAAGTLITLEATQIDILAAAPSFTGCPAPVVIEVLVATCTFNMPSAPVTVTAVFD